MTTFIIVHLIGAAVIFIALYLYAEYRTPAAVKALCAVTNESYVSYGRIILFSLLWEFAIVILLLVIIAEIVKFIIDSIRRRK